MLYRTFCRQLPPVPSVLTRVKQCIRNLAPPPELIVTEIAKPSSNLEGGCKKG